jgi:hypothetical protein
LKRIGHWYTIAQKNRVDEFYNLIAFIVTLHPYHILYNSIHIKNVFPSSDLIVEFMAFQIKQNDVEFPLLPFFLLVT